LWDSLKFEILNVQEEDLAQEALAGLAAVARTLSQGTSGPLNAYLRPIIKECNEHFEDAPTKQSQASAQILHAIADVSPEVSNILIAGVLPNLFLLFQTADTMAKRRGLLEVLVQLIRANVSVYGDWRTTGRAGEQAPANALAQFQDQVLEVMLNGLENAPAKEVSFRLVCLDGLLQLSKARQLLSDEDMGKIIQVFHAIIIHEDPHGKDEVKDAAINGLVEIAHQKPQVVIDKAFPAFMAQLPDTDVDQSKAYVPVLEAFAKLGSEEDVFDTVILRLKNKFSSAVKQGASSSYIVALLSAILYALRRGSAKLEQSPDASPYYQDIVLPLLQRASSSDDSHPKAFDDETTLDLVGRICNIVVRPQSIKEQNNVSAEIYTLFRETPLRELPPFNTKASPEQSKLMIVSTHLLSSLRKETTLPCDVQPLISALVEHNQRSDLSTTVRAVSLRQISILINKFVPTSGLKTFMDPLIADPVDLFNPDKLNPLRIRIIFACLKGLLLRNATSLSKLYPHLLSYLSHAEYGITVAHGFAGLLQPDDLLTKQNHCQISGLHKQKTFTLLVPNIVQGYRDAIPATKKNYLIALSGVLKWMPFEIVIEEVGSLVPLLLQSLDLKNEDLVTEAAISSLTSILQERPETVEEHAGSLISRLLANGTGAGKESPGPLARVRVEALKCLMLVPEKLKMEVVLPYRREVCKRLTKALDDRKREVRWQAVRCRAKWLDVDEVGDDD
jgi:DNA repair/transcription protein MET18/MMS19